MHRRCDLAGTGIFSFQETGSFYGDLKPANIMMTDQKRLYLVDFGSAVFSYSASYKETKGTRGYAAPEQLHGKISAASDFYALGKTMEVLCGKKKFRYFFEMSCFGKIYFQMLPYGAGEALARYCRRQEMNYVKFIR